MEDEHMQHNRLYWRSRRGMTELELILLPFFRDLGPDLAPDDKQAYADLLEEEDWQIFDWLQGRETPQTPDMARIVARIREYDANAHG